MSYKDYLGLLLPQKMKPSEVLSIVATEKGQANGLASLDGGGKVPSSQLPSYVDDVLEFNEFSDFPLTGQTGKIYLDKDEDKIYRWSGSQYIEISSGGASYQYIADGTSQSVLLGNISANKATGQYSIAEGNASTASGTCSHAEGYQTRAMGVYTHTEGYQTRALGYNSHAEGMNTQANGSYSHVEGQSAIAEGTVSHAEGVGAIARGDYSHAEGSHTQAKYMCQHVFGEYNIVDNVSGAGTTERGTYVEIVGNGTDVWDETSQDYITTRSNARTLDWDGNETLAGKLTVGTGPTAPMDVATKQYVDNNASSGPAILATTATLSSSSWSNNSQTVNVTGVTASNIVIVTYAPASKADYVNAGIGCSAQGAGTLTFECSTVPSSNIIINALIIDDTISSAEGGSF